MGKEMGRRPGERRRRCQAWGQPESGPESRVRGGRKQEPRNRVMGQPTRGTETPSARLQVMGE